jgi:hypothetical protein
VEEWSVSVCELPFHSSEAVDADRNLVSSLSRSCLSSCGSVDTAEDDNWEADESVGAELLCPKAKDPNLEKWSVN